MMNKADARPVIQTRPANYPRLAAKRIKLPPGLPQAGFNDLVTASRRDPQEPTRTESKRRLPQTIEISHSNRATIAPGKQHYP
jgi:hypothetical protein